MKVALLSDCYPPRTGGIESQVSDLAVHLQAAGHEVEVFTATRGAKGERGGTVETVDGIPVHRMALQLPRDIPVNPMAPPMVRARLQGGGFDVAHVHLGVVSPFAWDMARVTTGLGMPTALTFHCVLDKAALTLRPALRTWTGQGAVLSAVSDLAAAGVRHAAPGVPVGVVPNGIAPGEWPAGPVRSTARPLRVVTATRLAPRKRVGALLRVVADAHARVGPGALVLDVFGDGAMRALLESHSAALGLGDVVRWRGSVSRSELAGHYRECDVYLSTTRLEAFGIAALEARTTGLPVIARADSGVGEVITDGVSGLLAADDAGLADALVRLTADSTLRTRIAGHNASTPPSQSWEQIADLVVGEYLRAGA
ncbi:glycosyltransferase family 4 protein [Janibacter alittae]|uniref:D-inositol 3-phosphate glycosyltransferase n=1 Tax=Janibacter alittae TaxID=3115209 RepID=A0ABZ2MF88_9MICO